jgi:uncharacterized protein (TIGR00251 family)
VSPAALAEKDGVLTVDVQVVPRASRPRLGPFVGDRLKVQVSAPPVDGEANQAVVELFARSLKVPRRDVTIIAGETGRRKTLRIAGATAAQLLALVEVSHAQK